MEPFTVKGSKVCRNVLKKSWHVGWLYGYRQTKNMNKSIGRTEFMNEVAGNISLNLVQFKTEWNGACQIVAMIYDDLAKSYKGIANFFTVDIETENLLAKEYGVMEVPAILFFRNGKVIDHAKGLIPKNVLISKIENALSASKQ